MLMVRMDEGSIVPIFHAVTIDTMLNNNGVKNGHGLKDVTCGQAFTLTALRRY